MVATRTATLTAAETMACKTIGATAEATTEIIASHKSAGLRGPRERELGKGGRTRGGRKGREGGRKGGRKEVGEEGSRGGLGQSCEDTNLLSALFPGSLACCAGLNVSK